MHSRLKVIRHGEEVTLISRNDGTALACLLILEIALLAPLNFQLASVLGEFEMVWLPLSASLALVVWTARQIRPDVRITLSHATGTGRIVRIAPVTGTRTTAEFGLDAISSLSLEQTTPRPLKYWPLKVWPFDWRPFAPKDHGEYVVAIELRNGSRHLLSARGPLQAYQESVGRFTGAAGIGVRSKRMPVG